MNCVWLAANHAFTAARETLIPPSSKASGSKQYMIGHLNFSSLPWHQVSPMA
ncbi:Uncharacterised protein [Vibrio cholerae]|nr:Uncharacterised protein [Vibrio cholerae]